MISNTPINSSQAEVDYDINPTQLYSLIEKKNFKEAISRCTQSPNEASTWIVKKEDGQIKWRLLPLHAAILFRSESLVKTLLNTYAEGAKETDDQGMRALHLAFRFNASESIINKLLAIDSDGMDAKDHKGRTPFELVNMSVVNQDGKNGNKFRAFAASLFHQLESADATADVNTDTSSASPTSKDVSDLEQKLLIANSKLAKLESASEKARRAEDEDEDELQERIEELEEELKNAAENFNRTVSMYEKRNTLHENETSVLNGKLMSLTEENENINEMYQKVQERYTKETDALKKKQAKFRADNSEYKDKIKELLNGIDVVTKTNEKERAIAAKYEKASKAEIAKHLSKIDEQYDLILTLESHISENSDKIQGLSECLEKEAFRACEMEKAYVDEKEQKGVLQEELSKLESELESKKVENDLLQGKFQVLCQEKADQDDEMKYLKQQNTNIQSKLTDTDNKKNQLSDELHKAKDNISVLSQEKTDRDNSITTLQEELSNLQSKLTDTDNKNNQLSDELHKAKDNISALSQEISVLSQEKTDRDNSITTLQEELSELNVNLTSSKANFKRLSNEHARLKSDSEVEKCAHENEVKNFENDHSILRSKCSTLTATIVEMKETSAQQTDDLECMKLRIRKLEEEYRVVDEYKSSLERNYEDLKKTCDNYDRKVESLAGKLQLMSGKYETLLSESEKKRLSFAEEKRSLDNELIDIKGRYDSLVLTHKKEMRQTDTQKYAADNQIELLLKNIEQHNIQHSTLSEKYNSLKRKYDDAVESHREEVREQAEKRMNSEMELQVRDTELMRLKKALEDMSSVVIDLQGQMKDKDELHEKEKSAHILELEAFEQKLRQFHYNLSQYQDEEEFDD